MTTIRKGIHLYAAAFMLLFSMLLMTSGPLVFAVPVDSTGDTTQTGVQTGTAQTAETGTTAETTTKKSKRANKWIEKKGYMYYYDDLGKKVTGKKKIGNHTYLFDNKGRQKTGWQKIGRYCYFFRNKNGKYGYMIKNKTVNQIRLKKNGRAAVSSGNRMNVLLQCSQLVESCTKPTWSKSQKMQTMWKWMYDNIDEIYVRYNNFSGWGSYYAALCLSNHKGACEGMGCLWAFLANACGANNCYCVASGGHGWAEVEGRIYDNEWSRHSKADSYYAMDPALSGKGGRPPYSSSGIYREKV